MVIDRHTGKVIEQWAKDQEVTIIINTYKDDVP